MDVKCEGCGGHFPYFEDPSERPYADCPSCHSLTKVGERPPLNVPNMEAFTDSDRWNPWVPHLSPMDTPRYKEWIRTGKVRLNPATGAMEGYCSTRKEYAARVKECGFTTDWLGQGDRSKRREDKREWVEERPSGKVYFT